LNTPSSCCSSLLSSGWASETQIWLKAYKQRGQLSVYPFLPSAGVLSLELVVGPPVVRAVVRLGVLAEDWAGLQRGAQALVPEVAPVVALASIRAAVPVVARAAARLEHL
jgi:hypothetical protein